MSFWRNWYPALVYQRLRRWLWQDRSKVVDGISCWKFPDSQWNSQTCCLTCTTWAVDYASIHSQASIIPNLQYSKCLFFFLSNSWTPVNPWTIPNSNPKSENANHNFFESQGSFHLRLKTYSFEQHWNRTERMQMRKNLCMIHVNSEIDLDR